MRDLCRAVIALRITPLKQLPNEDALRRKEEVKTPEGEVQKTKFYLILNSCWHGVGAELLLTMRFAVAQSRAADGSKCLFVVHASQ